MAACGPRVRAPVHRACAAADPCHPFGAPSISTSRQRSVPPTLDHLLALSDGTGIIQHAVYDVPNRSTGYCVDDVARAFIVAVQAAPYRNLREDALRAGRIYLSFLHDAQLLDGRFRNFMAYDRTWLEDVGSEDACGRAIWAIGVGVRSAPLAQWRQLCSDMLARSLGAIAKLTHVHARAYAMLGLVAASGARPSAALTATLRELATDLRDRFRVADDGAWAWFEDTMTYDNARLCEALVRAGVALDEPHTTAVGLDALRFLESVTFEDDRFVPIGNLGWYARGGERARYDQQPLEAAAMVDAELAAFAVTADDERLARAEDAFTWYLGSNDCCEALARAGGCCDGLSEHGVNENMGAESTLAYLSSAFALAEAQVASVSKNPGDDRRNRRPERRPA